MQERLQEIKRRYEKQLSVSTHALGILEKIDYHECLIRNIEEGKVELKSPDPKYLSDLTVISKAEIDKLIIELVELEDQA